MTYAMKPLACDPTRIKGMSEQLILSHYENNYGGAVNRLNAITAQLGELDFTKAPGFVINGLKREELFASNSMILHELFFASLGDESAPEDELRDALTRDICTSTPITWITERERAPMSMRSWRRLIGRASRVRTANCIREPHTRPPDDVPSAASRRPVCLVRRRLR